MQRYSHLPPPPDFGIEVVRARRPDEPPFLTHVSRLVRTVGPSGERSETLIYDEVDRPALDAVVVAAHFVSVTDGSSARFVVLRSALRPPLSLRTRPPAIEPENRSLWELPAGLVEPEEQSERGLLLAAARELFEETGLKVEPKAFCSLGPPAFPAPGIIAERQFFFHVEVDPESAQPPPLDGSPLERAGQVIAVPLAAALRSAREGRLPDEKTELALRRLADEVRA